MKSTKKHSSFSMQETDEAEEENEDLSDRQKQIREGGAVVTKNRKHTIQCLTVIGQIEGHYVAPSQNKTTKYEHVIPQIVSVEEDPNIDGLLVMDVGTVLDGDEAVAEGLIDTLGSLHDAMDCLDKMIAAEKNKQRAKPRKGKKSL